jgi:hypothetical protein
VLMLYTLQLGSVLYKDETVGRVCAPRARAIRAEERADEVGSDG